MNRATHLLRNFLQPVADFLLPRRCLVCGQPLTAHEAWVCTPCGLRLPYTGYCGKRNNPMERLLLPQRHLERASAYLFYYQGADSCRLVTTLKYDDQPSLGIYLGRAMAAELEATGFFQGVDAIVPIPLARRRQFKRGYNQSERLAAGVAQVTGLPVWKRVVVRTKDNPTQTHLSLTERRRNVEGIFQCNNGEKLRGKHVLLMDDVVTTGATILSCMDELARKAPDVRLSVLTLAQAATPGALPDAPEPDFDI